jgi:protein-S-isoprenylcysteine O-methyltransferase Ste14
MRRWPGTLSLALRSALWTVLLPGMVAFYIPWRFFGVSAARVRLAEPVHSVALIAIALGTAILLLCIWEFAHSGRGTLAPVDAPRELVVQGLYRYVRNPMYVGVATILIGELLLVRSVALLIYFLIFFIGVNAFIIGYEEPALRRRFGASYEDYRAHVRRWLPRLRG